jgi:hypothetical protein
MTRRDFIMLSSALYATKQRIMDDALLTAEQKINQLRGVRRAACHIADAIAEDNPTFDMQRFLTDCGYGATPPAYRPRDMDDAGQPVVPPPPRESAKQISARLMRNEKPDPRLISNVNRRREEGQ